MISPASRYRFLIAVLAVPTAWWFWVTAGAMAWNGALGSVIVMTPVLASGVTLLTCLASLWKPQRRHRKILLVTIPVLILTQLFWLALNLIYPPSKWGGTPPSASELARFHHNIVALEVSLAICLLSLFPLFLSGRWLAQFQPPQAVSHFE